jgi:putative ABC transport system permease protein
MLKTFLTSFSQAIVNIRANFFHTLLSVLGIVIGVASLVAILSLIDGMENFAKRQIEETTSIKAIAVNSRTLQTIHDVRVKLDTIKILTPEKLSNKTWSKPANTYWNIEQNVSIKKDTSILAFRLIASSPSATTKDTLLFGRSMGEQESKTLRPLWCNEQLVSQLNPKKKNSTGDTLTINGKLYVIAGIWKQGKSKMPIAVTSITSFTDAELQANPPTYVVDAHNVEDVGALKAEITTWLKTNFYDAEKYFAVQSNEMRVEQATKGFLLFIIIMGLIVGISVLVGGIGVMNVLLISVTERTAEIGIRKALGANKSAILFQFLSESVAISAFGCTMGLILGVAGTMLFIPIIRSLTEMPFEAAFTANTLIIISIVALMVGIIFGTYPAMRAAKLDPVEAIRKE